ncbi:MAG: MlaD family protein [Verrucomicrobiales bacterium]
MTILRNEIRTGLLVVVSLVVLVGVLLYLGAPGVFTPQKTYRIYFDNAAGIKQGAAVMLAGRKVGQVHALFSPVDEDERPTPEMETLVEVQVEAKAKIYKKVKVLMTQTSLLGETIIDFTNGQQESGIADHEASFIGERPAGLAEAVPAILERIDPVLAKATTTLASLEETAGNISKLTREEADLPVALAELRKSSSNLTELTGSEGSLPRSLKNIESMTSPEGKLGQAAANIERLTNSESSLTKTLSNTEKFTAELSSNKDIGVTLRNFRTASEKLNRTVDQLGPRFSAVGANLEQASDTLKRQPWRLIYPTTKKYPEEALKPPAPRVKEPAVPVRKKLPSRTR